jgi:hypothetical protein
MEKKVESIGVDFEDGTPSVEVALSKLTPSQRKALAWYNEEIKTPEGEARVRALLARQTHTPLNRKAKRAQASRLRRVSK